MTAQLTHALAQLHAIDHSRLRIQGNIHSAREVRLTWITPAVVRATLDSDIATLHEALLAALQLELQLAFDADPNVQRDGAVPDLLGHVRVVVNVADDGTPGDHEWGLVDEVVGVAG